MAWGSHVKLLMRLLRTLNEARVLYNPTDTVISLKETGHHPTSHYVMYTLNTHPAAGLEISFI